MPQDIKKRTTTKPQDGRVPSTSAPAARYLPRENVRLPRFIIMTGIRESMYNYCDSMNLVKTVNALTGRSKLNCALHTYPEDMRDNYGLYRWLDDLTQCATGTVRLILTCSSFIINDFGTRIRDKQLSSKDVLVSFNYYNYITEPYRYNDKGQIDEWPYGFYNPRDGYYDNPNWISKGFKTINLNNIEPPRMIKFM